MLPRGVPDGVDAETRRRVQRSFLMVRIVRGGLLLAFLAIAAVAVELRGWPHAVTVVLALAALAQAGALVAGCRRYRSLLGP